MTTFSFTLTTPAVAPGAVAAPLAHELAHGDLAIENLLYQFRDKPRIEAMLRDLIDMNQTAEDLLWQLVVERGLNAVNGEGPAIGDQLDGLGRIVGEPRAEKVDDEYRTFLRIRILVNNSDGLLEDLNGILDLIGFETIKIQELHPANIKVYVTGSVYSDTAFSFLKQAKAGGVGMLFFYTSELLADTFQMSHYYAQNDTDATSGFSSVYGPATGGKLVGVFQS